MPSTSFLYSMLSDPGRVRRNNEDACGASRSLRAFVVCDGMGGAAGGEIASHLAVEAFLEQISATDADEYLDPRHRLQGAIDAANAAVFGRSVEAPGLRGMGTTLVALLLSPEGSGGNGRGSNPAYLAHVGDSRAYLLRGERLHQLTQDHSLVEEQVLAGQITRQQAERSPMRNVITRAVGSHEDVLAELQRQDALPGDLFLLASDGLTRELTCETIAAILLDQPDLDDAVAALIMSANRRGGGDNITVLLVRILASSDSG